MDTDEPPLEFFREMMRREGLLPAVTTPLEASLESLPDVLSEVTERDEFVLIHSEGRDDEGDLALGRVVAADDLHVRVRPVSATGVWEREQVIDTLGIRRVEFGSPYLRALRKYAHEPDTAW